jgi:uncharacterized OsmC-like protein
MVVVHGAGSGFAQEVIVGRHRLIADEPETAGGADKGPSPYDYQRCPVHRTLTSEINIRSRLVRS